MNTAAHTGAAAAAAYRRRLLDVLVPALRQAGALACWEGAYPATGRGRQVSDIDLWIVAPLADAERERHGDTELASFVFVASAATLPSRRDALLSAIDEQLAHRDTVTPPSG